jgi:hypothetical protein
VNFFPYSIPAFVQLVKSEDGYQIRLPIYNEDGLRFEYEPGGLYVSGADPDVTELEIPETYQGIQVVGIASGALSELKQLTQEVVYEVKTSKVGMLCPVCHQGTVIKGRTAYGCSRWREGCSYREPFAVDKQNAH